MEKINSIVSNASFAVILLLIAFLSYFEFNVEGKRTDALNEYKPVFSSIMLGEEALKELAQVSSNDSERFLILDVKLPSPQYYDYSVKVISNESYHINAQVKKEHVTFLGPKKVTWEVVGHIKKKEVFNQY